MHGLHPLGHALSGEAPIATQWFCRYATCRAHKTAEATMAAPRLRKTYEALSVSATVSHGGAIISFLTRDDEDVVVAIDLQTLAALQRQIARGLAPVGDSSAQP